ncbi:hypothetical protein AUEXF2481DRAFT_389924 [Aureobasidium subglaciale EXF-2481]|uniref:Oxidoreductase NAD-binding domain-containing protein 1 n=1 Tax=Aureobasidium subglaciale (strain EXF-2481) TaxID=1043005 RepID=A0A074ZKP2_AURSE|nr:uncharacterized protein AUEXF2481DRAFT_389924 [Aureobasidium subglaciale EXF-2481]KAI5205563.1 hypothetical protein E4T38_04223 [Aureobasidium subglaciale]KAI5224497.1 hypothetical protein E4T40_03965 [Aureobasidium subglaciale]KAI5227816.1 hypothetical protein E4T41_04185 [Aureobasidium subglaciale]KAI5263259.1 hypothetical protein E4T46_03806 [Aureobasidium subglaciale]KEQ99021.1 hypothetical protein AUEXF2481DRAFT_389924 [Aureobasidium subglaciale EXF-2481]
MPDSDTAADSYFHLSNQHTSSSIVLAMSPKLLNIRAVSYPIRSRICFNRTMATVRSSISHEERTAQEPREARLEPVIVSRIDAVNDTVRLIRLSAMKPDHKLKFLPGQWLDVFIPSLSKAGGFTITSIPSDQGQPTPQRPAYFELAIQKSTNPPAQWLWKPESEILDEQIIVRTGGSFVWPPPGINIDEIEQVVLVAGGVGINPLISIFAHLMSLPKRPKKVRFVYGSKVEEGPIEASRILFLTRIMELIKKQEEGDVQLDLFLTAASQKQVDEARGLPEHVKLGRIGKDDLEASVGEDRGIRQATVAYICGPPAMTDQFVDFLSTRDGMDKRKVLCEKWW